MRKIREVVNNRDQAASQRKQGLSIYPSEEILGSMKLVKDFAAFYAVHKADLEVIKANYLLDYCEAPTVFTAEQYNAYKMGLDALLSFFESAETDVESYLLEAESKNNKKKSVG